MMLIILIHTSLIGQNIRDNEVNSSLNSSMDYAFDKMMDYYEDEQFIDYYTYNNVTKKWEIDTDKENEIVDSLMTEFCNTISSLKNSEASMKIELKTIDLTAGVFEVKVTEEFPYFYGNKTGTCTYQKCYSLT